MFHKDWENQHSEEASLETCRSVWAVSDQGCKIPPGLWMSFCWGSCWWSQRGHWPGPRSCWGTPWSRYQQCPSPGHQAEIGNVILSRKKNSIGKIWYSNSFLNFFLSLFPDCIVPFCWEFRWSRPVGPRCRPRMSENIRWHQTMWQLAGHGLTDLHGIGAALIMKSRSALAVLQYLLKGSFKEAIGHLVPISMIFWQIFQFNFALGIAISFLGRKSIFRILQIKNYVISVSVANFD